jgi:glycerophosphoryl diester phosphodiesterase
MQQPLIIAHRAQSQRGIENARTSLRLAADEGADLIELDVRLTLDRKPVIMHDALLGRTTSGRGPVGMVPSCLLNRISLLADDVVEHVPTLREIIAIAPESCQLAFHLKSRRAIGVVLRTIRSVGDPGRTWLWLERMEDIYRATRELPELRCTLLRPAAWTPGRRGEYFHDAQAAGARAVSVPSGAVSPELVHHAHQHHLAVFSRIDHVTLLPELVANGLDGAITSDPKGAYGVLKSIGMR